MERFEIVEYDPVWANEVEDMFLRYAREDLRDDLPEDVLREKIWRGLFLKGWAGGVLFIALALAEGKPAGFAVYQVDSSDSDWCRREGWGLIREFYVAPAHRRKGCGRALASRAEARLREMTDRLYLTAHDEAAARFWEACGFRETGEINDNGARTMTK